MFAHMESLSNATTSMINGVDIHHESMGDDSSPCVLICNGLAMTMSYTGGFAERFVDMGFRVINERTYRVTPAGASQGDVFAF